MARPRRNIDIGWSDVRPDRFLSVVEVAALLRVDRKTVWDYLHRSSNPLPGRQPPDGGEWKILGQDLLAWWGMTGVTFAPVAETKAERLRRSNAAHKEAMRL